MATSSKTSKSTHAVIAWEKKGEEELTNELIEVVAMSKIIVKGETTVGSNVCMQFKNELWSGSILSLHGSKSAAVAASKENVDPESPSTTSANMATKRKRSSKAFTEYIDGYSDQPDDSEEESEPIRKKSGSNGKARAKKPKSNKNHEQLQILSCQLSAIENTILSPECETASISTDSDSQLDSASQKESQQTSTPKNNHPQFGGKRPKNHPPPRCINLKCRKEREANQKEIEDLKLKVENLQEELECRTNVMDTTICNNNNSDSERLCGKLPRELAISLGLTELINGQNVWICPSRLTAAVKDAENKSRKVLARSLLSIFYDAEQLAKKSLTDLDKEIVEACVDFAMVAKLQNVPNVKKAEIRQALRCKLNSLRFSKTKPGYYKEYRKTKKQPATT